MTPFGYTMTSYVAALAIGFGSFLSIQPRLIWNASASAPIGLYAIEPSDRLEVGDLVAVDPPARIAGILADRGYLPRGGLLVKRIAALTGQQACRTGRDIMIDGKFAAAARERDSRGRELPVWQGCRTIAGGEVLLLNAGVPDSLDGRYFGSLPASAVIGRTQPLYVDVTGNGHFAWRPSIQ